MANWASTSYAVEGPEETLEKINHAILHPAVNENFISIHEIEIVE